MKNSRIARAGCLGNPIAGRLVKQNTGQTKCAAEEKSRLQAAASGKECTGMTKIHAVRKQLVGRKLFQLRGIFTGSAIGFSYAHFAQITCLAAHVFSNYGAGV